MARFSNYYLILNPIPQTPNMSLHAVTVQDKNAVIVIGLDTEVENTKS